MRQIKFRGRRLDNGQFVYGDFVHYVPQSSFPSIVDEDGFVHEVKPESVAQLGDVIDGVEYYDGDERIVDGKSFICRVKNCLGGEIMNVRDWLPWCAVAFAGGFGFGLIAALYAYYSLFP